MGSCLSTSNAGGMPSRKEIERITAEALAREAENDHLLSQIEGRICANGATSVASLHTQQGKKGPNQDCMIIWEKFGCEEDTTFLGVFDGHGPYGHLVGKKVRDTLPSLLLNQKLQDAFLGDSFGIQEKTIPKDIGLDEWSDNFAENDIHKTEEEEEEEEERDVPAFLGKWKGCHLRAFKVMDKELKLNSSLDCHCSGTTAVTVIKQERELLLSNVGDSRAILGTLCADGGLSAVQLTRDMKPTIPKEVERIKQCNGRVFALHDEPHVHRVWLPNTNTPGLAMTRAFGDFCLKDFGVIAVPEISYRQLTDHDQFIVLATDGVWEVLSNDEVVQIVGSVSRRADAARFVVEAAVRTWKRKFPTSKVDDCAVVCLHLDLDKWDRNGMNKSDCTSASSEEVALTPLREEKISESMSNASVESQGSMTIHESLGDPLTFKESSSSEPHLTRADTIVTAGIDC
eukprot:TRINITY_DN9835_c1_g1_i2.p1 TRINITY_DN9835_c1_g1~~TRINITY_DN9835_c1_g1_i2.p1  ORF type:complete len:458 (-),score=116.17 TRINITY_DN9835_c1_g1_i2:217-1590(-)